MVLGYTGILLSVGLVFGWVVVWPRMEEAEKKKRTEFLKNVPSFAEHESRVPHVNYELFPKPRLYGSDRRRSRPLTAEERRLLEEVARRPRAKEEARRRTEEEARQHVRDMMSELKELRKTDKVPLTAADAAEKAFLERRLRRNIDQLLAEMRKYSSLRRTAPERLRKGENAGLLLSLVYPPDLTGVPLVGKRDSEDGDAFRIVDPEGRPVIGIRCFRKQFTGICIARIEPVFERTAKPNHEHEDLVLAPEGLELRALSVAIDDHLRAVRCHFGPAGKAAGTDGEWIGKPGDHPVQRLDGGSRVIGVAGRKGTVIDAVGLVTR